MKSVMRVLFIFLVAVVAAAVAAWAEPSVEDMDVAWSQARLVEQRLDIRLVKDHALLKGQFVIEALEDVQGLNGWRDPR